MKRMFTIVILLLFSYLMFGSPVIAYHNYELQKSVTSIDTPNDVKLNEVVPFAWDIVYTFPPGTSKQEIENVIGFRSRAIQESDSKDTVQLLFIQNNEIVASICGDASTLGFRIDFDGSIRFEEDAVFSIDPTAPVIRLVKK